MTMFPYAGALSSAAASVPQRWDLTIWQEFSPFGADLNRQNAKTLFVAGTPTPPVAYTIIGNPNKSSFVIYYQRPACYQFLGSFFYRLPRHLPVLRSSPRR